MVELFIREGTGILEVAESLVGEAAEVAVGNKCCDGALTDIGDPKMLRDKDAEEVVDTIVGNDTIEVVDLVVQRNRLTAPGEIDGMGYEDVLVVSPDIHEIEIPLFAIRVMRVYRVRSSGGCCVYYGLHPLGRYAQTYLSVA